MPSRPASPKLSLTRSWRSANVVTVVVLLTLSNLLITPFCCTTYHCALLPGACSIRIGLVKDRFGNTRVCATEVPRFGWFGARHVALFGRESRPDCPPVEVVVTESEFEFAD